MANLLLLSDNPKRHDKLTSYLDAQGHSCRAAGSVRAAASTVDMRAPDIILLDAEGLQLLRELAVEHPLDGVQIVFIADAAALESLDLPPEVSDFLVSSAPPAEIRARILCVMRRGHRRGAKGALTIGDIVIDPERYVVTVSGNAVPLTLKEFELLRYLAESRGRVFTRETLLKKIWGYDYFGGTRTVDVHVRRLRSKIEPDPNNPVINTVRGVGYKID